MADLERLIQQLSDPTASCFTRAEAAMQLARLGDRRVIDPLATAAKDAESYVREKAVCALAELGGHEVVPPIVSALKDASSTIRRLAAQALGTLGDAAAIGALREATSDSSLSVVQAARTALDVLRKSHPEAFERPEPRAAGPRPVAPQPQPPPAEVRPPEPQPPPSPKAGQPYPPPAARPDAPPPRGMTKDELLAAALRGTDVHAAQTGDNITLRVPLPDGRHQDVELAFQRTEKDNDDIISLYTYCGPAVRTNFEWALRLNPRMPCGAIGLMEVGRKVLFVVSECLPLGDTTPRELRRAILSVAIKGDWLKKQLGGKNRA